MTVFGLFPMLTGVYMVKFDMLNPNLTSKITKKNSTRAKHIGKSDFQKIQQFF